MLLVSASSWRIITAGMAELAWRIFSYARWHQPLVGRLGGEHPDDSVPVPVHPGRVQLVVILDRLSPSQSMQVSAVNVSFTAADRARMAISSQLVDAERRSWVSGRLLPAGPGRAHHPALIRAGASGGRDEDRDEGQVGGITGSGQAARPPPARPGPGRPGSWRRTRWHQGGAAAGGQAGDGRGQEQAEGDVERVAVHRLAERGGTPGRAGPGRPRSRRSAGW